MSSLQNLARKGLTNVGFIIYEIQWQSSEGNFTIDTSVIDKISLKIIYLKFHSNLPGTNELTFYMLNFLEGT